MKTNETKLGSVQDFTVEAFARFRRPADHVEYAAGAAAIDLAESLGVYVYARSGVGMMATEPTKARRNVARGRSPESCYLLPVSMRI